MSILVSFLARDGALALIAAIITAFFALYWNFRSAKSARKLPFLQHQLDLCFEATELVGRLASTSDRTDWAVAHARFWVLYWGPLAIVEDDNVALAMIGCSDVLKASGSNPDLPLSALNAPSIKLSRAVRKLLIAAWKIEDLESVLQDRRQ